MSSHRAEHQRYNDQLGGSQVPRSEAWRGWPISHRYEGRRRQESYLCFASSICADESHTCFRVLVQQTDPVVSIAMRLITEGHNKLSIKYWRLARKHAICHCWFLSSPRQVSVIFALWELEICTVARAAAVSIVHVLQAQYRRCVYFLIPYCTWLNKHTNVSIRLRCVPGFPSVFLFSFRTPLLQLSPTIYFMRSTGKARKSIRPTPKEAGMVEAGRRLRHLLGRVVAVMGAVRQESPSPPYYRGGRNVIAAAVSVQKS